MTINWFSISKALAVRCLLTFHAIVCFWRVVVDLRDQKYWLLLCGLLPLVCETCYTLIRRQGVEFSRFTPCFLCYLVAVLPGIWLLELKRTDDYIQFKNSNTSEAEKYNMSSEFYIFQEVALDPNTWLIVIEEMLPYVMFASRWVLPRGRVRREELAELLFAFIEIAADIMEFFSLIGENVIRKDKALSFCVLSIWSLSILQFTMTVTVIHQPKKEKKVKVVVVEPNIHKEQERVRHECFAIFLTMAMQDLPFAIMRLYTIIKFQYINYSLIFFTSKNLIIIMLLLYKVIALCKNQYQRHTEDRAADADKKNSTYTDGAEKGLHNLQEIYATSKPSSIDDQKGQDSKNENNIESNHSNKSLDFILKKRTRKTETPDSGSPDSGGTIQSFVKSTTESEDTSSRKSIHLQKNGDAGYSPQLCLSCLSRIETTPDVQNSCLSRIETTPDVQNSWNFSNVSNDLKNLPSPDTTFSHVSNATDDTENESCHNQGDVEEHIGSDKWQTQWGEMISQCPESPVSFLALSIGGKQRQLVSCISVDASE